MLAMSFGKLILVILLLALALVLLPVIILMFCCMCYGLWCQLIRIMLWCLGQQKKEFMAASKPVKFGAGIFDDRELEEAVSGRHAESFTQN